MAVTAQSYWFNSKCGHVVVRFATFRTGDFGVTLIPFLGITFCHLSGVMLGHFFKECYESMAATLA